MIVLANAESSLEESDEGGDTYILKAFSERFGFDALRISQIPNYQSKFKATGTLYKDGSICVQIIVHTITYIGVGLSALLGLTDRAMRELLKRGSGDRAGSAFFMCMATRQTMTSAVVAGRNKTDCGISQQMSELTTLFSTNSRIKFACVPYGHTFCKQSRIPSSFYKNQKSTIHKRIHKFAKKQKIQNN